MSLQLLATNDFIEIKRNFCDSTYFHKISSDMCDNERMTFDKLFFSMNFAIICRFNGVFIFSVELTYNAMHRFKCVFLFCEI